MCASRWPERHPRAVRTGFGFLKIHERSAATVLTGQWRPMERRRRPSASHARAPEASHVAAAEAGPPAGLPADASSKQPNTSTGAAGGEDGASPRAGDAAGEARRLVRSSVAGASSLVAFVVVQRGATFVLNQALLRSTRPDVAGFALVELQLLLSTLLFLSREGIRLAAARASLDGEEAVARLTNLAWLSPAAASVLVVLAGSLMAWRYADAPESQSVPGALLAVALYCGAAILETLAEPVFVLVQARMMYALRARIEMVAVSAQCVVTYVAAAHFELGAPAFGVGQLAYAVALLGGYCVLYVSRLGIWKNLFPGRVTGASGSWFDSSQLSLARAFTGQSVLKHLLTEGDKIVLASSSNLFDQGVYAVVTNYGSLAARLLFQPLEETSRTMFSRLLAGQGASAGEGSGAAAAAVDVLKSLLKFVVIVGLVFSALGSNYTFVLLDLLLGSKWSVDTEAPAVLSLYCLYVLTMAANGMTEACVYAVANEAEVAVLNRRMIAFFLGYAATAFALLRAMGTMGIVLANILHMSARIVSSWAFLRGYFTARGQEFRVRHVLPPPVVLAAFAAAWAVTALARGLFPGDTLLSKAKHVTVGVVMACTIALSILLGDSEYLRKMRTILKSRKE